MVSIKVWFKILRHNVSMEQETCNTFTCKRWKAWRTMKQFYISVKVLRSKLSRGIWSLYRAHLYGANLWNNHDIKTFFLYINEVLNTPKKLTCLILPYYNLQWSMKGMITIKRVWRLCRERASSPDNVCTNFVIWAKFETETKDIASNRKEFWLGIVHKGRNEDQGWNIEVRIIIFYISYARLAKIIYRSFTTQTSREHKRDL